MTDYLKCRLCGSTSENLGMVGGVIALIEMGWRAVNQRVDYECPECGKEEDDPRPAHSAPVILDGDPVKARAYWEGCVRRDLKLANVTEWNLDRLIEMLDKRIAFLESQNRELSKGTEALVLEIAKMKSPGYREPMPPGWLDKWVIAGRKLFEAEEAGP